MIYPSVLFCRYIISCFTISRKGRRPKITIILVKEDMSIKVVKKNLTSPLLIYRGSIAKNFGTKVRLHLPFNINLYIASM